MSAPRVLCWRCTLERAFAVFSSWATSCVFATLLCLGIGWLVYLAETSDAARVNMVAGLVLILATIGVHLLRGAWGFWRDFYGPEQGDR